MIRDIALAHGDDPTLQSRLNAYQRRTLEDIASCGTAAAGLHLERCDACDDIRAVPNTCGNRSCPHCQGRARQAWVAAREAELLPCGYFHVVLTLPPALRGLARACPRPVLDALLQAAGQAIDRCCRHPRHLGATVGQLAVLHTWRRDLHWHPHVHVIVTAGGVNAAGNWVSARRYGRQRRAFLVPVAFLKAVFLRRLRRLLHQAFDRGHFADGPSTAFTCLASRPAFRSWLRRGLDRPPVLRVEPPFGGPRQLLRYLGAYVNRVALSPRRICAHDPQAGTVTYTWTTNARPHHREQTTLSATDFLLRFAQHILPPGFHRIRFRGLWATAHRATGLRRAQALLGGAPQHPHLPSPPSTAAPADAPNAAPCTACQCGYYRRILEKHERPSRARRRDRLREIRRKQREPTWEATICA